MLRKQLSSAIAKQMNPKLLKKQVTYVETRLLQTTVWIVEFVIINQHYLFRLEFRSEFLKISPASCNGQQKKLLSISRTDIIRILF